MPNFFISYRRSDQEGKYLAHMLHRDLCNRYGGESTFLDVDSPSPGLSYPAKIQRALDETDVVLVVMGPAWLKVLNARRPEPLDWVRYEIAQSLQRKRLLVVPVCGPGAEMPKHYQLPNEMKDLAFREGIALDPFRDFDAQVSRLLVSIERVLEGGEQEAPSLSKSVHLTGETGAAHNVSASEVDHSQEIFEPIVQFVTQDIHTTFWSGLFLYTCTTAISIIITIEANKLIVFIVSLACDVCVFAWLWAGRRRKAQRILQAIAAQAFSETQTRQLMALLGELKRNWMTKLFIPSALEEVMEFSDAGEGRHLGASCSQEGQPPGNKFCKTRLEQT